MKKCNQCKKILFKDAKFCPNCGNSLGEKKTDNKSKSEANPYKCIHCGADYKAYSCVCPYCGKDQIGEIRSKSIIEFTNQLKKYDDSKSKSAIGSLVNGSKNKNIEEQKRNYIKTFVVPNSKEDVLEFMVLASSNIDPMVMLAKHRNEVNLKEKEFQKQKQESLAWNAKIEQVYEKASAAFGEDSDFVVIKRIYDRKEKAINKIIEKKEAEKKKMMAIGVASVAILILISVLGLVLDNGDAGYSTSNAEIVSEDSNVNNYNIAEEMNRTIEIIEESEQDITVNENEEVIDLVEASNLIEADEKADAEVQAEEEAPYTFTELSEIYYAQRKVNIRDLPEKDGKVVGSLSTNDEVNVTGKCDQTSWYRISYLDGVAYVHNEYLSNKKVEVKEDTALTQEPPTIANNDNSSQALEKQTTVVDTAPAVETPSSSGGSSGGGDSVIVPGYEDTQGNLVWVPTNGGTKYHSKSTCSNMNNPMQVTVEHAEANGYTRCKRCKW